MIPVYLTRFIRMELVFLSGQEMLSEWKTNSKPESALRDSAWQSWHRSIRLWQCELSLGKHVRASFKLLSADAAPVKLQRHGLLSQA